MDYKEQRITEALAEYQRLRKMSKADLKTAVHQVRRVVDTSTADKASLIYLVIEGKFGRKVAEGMYDRL